MSVDFTSRLLKDEDVPDRFRGIPKPKTEQGITALYKLAELLKLRFPPDPTTDGPAEVVKNFLFLGDSTMARQTRMLKENGFTHVINVAEADTDQSHYEALKGLGITTIGFDTSDTPNFPILDDCFDKLRVILDGLALPKGQHKVLLHCQAGVNRSGVLAIAYAMYLIDRNFKINLQREQQNNNNKKEDDVVGNGDAEDGEDKMSKDNNEKKKCISLYDVAGILKRRRGRICTNQGFQQQLIVFGEEQGWQLM